MSSKNREQVVNECATAVAGCWGHYSDHPLSQDAIGRIADVLSNELPESISTTEWQKYSDEYDREKEALANEEDDYQEQGAYAGQSQTERAHEAYSKYGKVSVCGQTTKYGEQAICVYFEKMNKGVALEDAPTEFEGACVVVRLTGKIKPL